MADEKLWHELVHQIVTTIERGFDEVIAAIVSTSDERSNLDAAVDYVEVLRLLDDPERLEELLKERVAKRRAQA